MISFEIDIWYAEQHLCNKSRGKGKDQIETDITCQIFSSPAREMHMLGGS